MNAVWYMQSRGIDQLQDYSWLPVGGDPGDARRHAEIKRIRRHRWEECVLDDLAKDKYPGLVLAHGRGLGTIVYVPCVPLADPPLDAVGRVIRAALVGIADEPFGREQLVAVAAASLTGELDGRFPVSHDTGTPAGFSLDVGAWQSLVAEYVSALSDPPDAGEHEGADGVDAGVDGDADGAYEAGHGNQRDDENEDGEAAEYGHEDEAADPYVPSSDPAELEDGPETREQTAADLRALLQTGGFDELLDRVIVLRAPVRNRAVLENRPPWRVLAEEYVWEPRSGKPAGRPPIPRPPIPGPDDVRRRLSPVVKGSLSALAGVAVAAGVIIGVRQSSRPPPAASPSQRSVAPSAPASAPQTPLSPSPDPVADPSASGSTLPSPSGSTPQSETSKKTPSEKSSSKKSPSKNDSGKSGNAGSAGTARSTHTA